MNRLVLFIIIFSLSGCSPSGDTSIPAAKKQRSHEVKGEFRSKSYYLSDHEHVVIFDIPDRFTPTRCWTYVNEKTNSSNMHCDDEGAIELPPQGQELER